MKNKIANRIEKAKVLVVKKAIIALPVAMYCLSIWTAIRDWWNDPHSIWNGPY